VSTDILLLTPRNWQNFQHYKDRCPPWVKLHRDLLNNKEFMRLPTASKALAPMFWLLASESKLPQGTFDASDDELEFRLRIPLKDIQVGRKSLIDNGFFIIASGVLADCEQPAIPEESRGETEREREGEKEQKPRSKPRQQIPADFEPNEKGIEAALAKSVSVSGELQNFRDYHTAKGSVMADWQAAWRTWVGNARPTLAGGRAGPTLETPYQRAQRERMQQWAPGVAAKDPSAQNTIEAEAGYVVAIESR
jgi:hypothetical protein